MTWADAVTVAIVALALALRALLALHRRRLASRWRVVRCWWCGRWDYAPRIVRRMHPACALAMTREWWRR
jgi:hypothetical protein